MNAMLLAVTVAIGGAPQVATELGFSPADWEVMTRGEALTHVETEKSPTGSARAHAECGLLIHRPLKRCFEEVERYEGLSKYLPGLAESRVLDRSPDGFRAHAATQVLWMKYGYGLLFHVDRAANEIRWQLDRSQKADIADTEGTWHFAAVDDNTTLVRYTMKADSGSAMPQAIQNFFTERSLPQMLRAFREHLEATPL